MRGIPTPEMPGLKSEARRDASYNDILQEVLSERRRIERLGESSRYLKLTCTTGEALRRLGRVFEANIEYEMTKNSDYIPAQIWANWGRGATFRQVGSYDASANAFWKAAALAREENDDVAWLYAWAGLAESIRVKGALREALRHHKGITRKFNDRGNHRGVVWGLEGIAQIYLKQGNPTSARRLFYEARRIARSRNDVRGAGWAARGLIECERALGDNKKARRFAVEAETLFKRIGMRVGIGYTLLSIVRNETVAQNYGLALTALVEAQNEFHASGHERGQIYADYEKRRLGSRF